MHACVNGACMRMVRVCVRVCENGVCVSANLYMSIHEYKLITVIVKDFIIAR